MSALRKFKTLADKQSIIEWSEHINFDPVQIDCLTVLMLEIVNQESPLDERHQEVIIDIFAVTEHRAGDLFDPDIYVFIQQAMQQRDPLHLGYIRDLSRYASDVIPAAKMYAFKQYLWDSLYL